MPHKKIWKSSQPLYLDVCKDKDEARSVEAQRQVNGGEVLEIISGTQIIARFGGDYLSGILGQQLTLPDALVVVSRGG